MPTLLKTSRERPPEHVVTPRVGRGSVSVEGVPLRVALTDVLSEAVAAAPPAVAVEEETDRVVADSKVASQGVAVRREEAETVSAVTDGVVTGEGTPIRAEEERESTCAVDHRLVGDQGVARGSLEVEAIGSVLACDVPRQRGRVGALELKAGEPVTGRHVVQEAVPARVAEEEPAVVAVRDVREEDVARASAVGRVALVPVRAGYVPGQLCARRTVVQTNAVNGIATRNVPDDSRGRRTDHKTVLVARRGVTAECDSRALEHTDAVREAADTASLDGHASTEVHVDPAERGAAAGLADLVAAAVESDVVGDDVYLTDVMFGQGRVRRDKQGASRCARRGRHDAPQDPEHREERREPSSPAYGHLESLPSNYSTSN